MRDAFDAGNRFRKECRRGHLTNYRPTLSSSVRGCQTVRTTNGVRGATGASNVSRSSMGASTRLHGGRVVRGFSAVN